MSVFRVLLTKNTLVLRRDWRGLHWGDGVELAGPKGEAGRWECWSQVPFGQAEPPSIHTEVRAGKGKLAPAGLPAA